MEIPPWLMAIENFLASNSWLLDSAVKAVFYGLVVGIPLILLLSIIGFGFAACVHVLILPFKVLYSLGCMMRGAWQLWCGV